MQLEINVSVDVLSYQLELGCSSKIVRACVCACSSTTRSSTSSSSLWYGSIYLLCTG